MIVVLNVGLILGAFLALFTLPKSTPVWIWAASSVTFVAGMNLLAYRRHRSCTLKGSDTSTREIVR